MQGNNDAHSHKSVNAMHQAATHCELVNCEPTKGIGIVPCESGGNGFRLSAAIALRNGICHMRAIARVHARI